ncbi:hypothetical protein VNO78_33758 [Psophocarpus tetragonolobus]|uniref:Malectin-like domain-containing protein n=1 Tax=Psophocarpus tetragonolobus TaxID=3891 RepID=A0AAN9RQX3_PSOTE
MSFQTITSVMLFLFLHLSSHLQAYTPANKFTVSCGTTGTSLDGERTWSGDADSKYLSTKDGTVSGEATKQGSSVNQVPYMKARLSYSEFKYSFPVTTGPQFIFVRTARESLNLTWEFPVDPGFAYLVRLHFCELDPNVNDVGDRVFLVYIANQLAEDYADVMRWSKKQKGVAVHRDYTVFIPGKGNQIKVNLSLKMQPFESNGGKKYRNPFLNGLEIFKTQNDQNIIVILGISQVDSDSGSKTTMGVIVGISCVGVVLISSFVVIFIYQRDVVLELEFALQLQQSADQCRNAGIVTLPGELTENRTCIIVGAGSKV